MFVFIPGAVSLYLGDFGLIFAILFSIVYVGVAVIVDAEIQAGEGKMWNNSLVGLAIWLG
jgi:uncharacterized membrane protein YagU involved in acid resistance